WRHHLAHRLLPVELPEVARGILAQGGSAHCVRRSRPGSSRWRDGGGGSLRTTSCGRRAKMTGTLTAFRLLSENDKAAALLSAVEKIKRHTPSRAAFVISLDDLMAIPGCPLAYWVTPGIRKVFRRFPVFENEDAGRTTRCGLGTLDDFRFLRLNWEVSGDRTSWITYYGGGIYSPFYDQVALLVRWAAGGEGE